MRNQTYPREQHLQQPLNNNSAEAPLIESQRSNDVQDDVVVVDDDDHHHHQHCHRNQSNDNHHHHRNHDSITSNNDREQVDGDGKMSILLVCSYVRCDHQDGDCKVPEISTMWHEFSLPLDLARVERWCHLVHLRFFRITTLDPEDDRCWQDFECRRHYVDDEHEIAVDRLRTGYAYFTCGYEMCEDHLGSVETVLLPSASSSLSFGQLGDDSEQDPFLSFGDMNFDSLLDLSESSDSEEDNFSSLLDTGYDIANDMDQDSVNSLIKSFVRISDADESLSRMYLNNSHGDLEVRYYSSSSSSSCIEILHLQIILLLSALKHIRWPSLIIMRYWEVLTV